MADFDFEHGFNWKGDVCSTLNLDARGRAYEYDTVGTWEFYAYPRDTSHVNPFHPDLPEFRWDCQYNDAPGHAQGIADGYCHSLEECEREFMEMWPRIRRHKVCTHNLPNDFSGTWAWERKKKANAA